MRVGEVLKLTPKDIEDRKAIIRDPKSGKEAEVAFLPQKVADRLKKYISDNGIKPEDRIFPVTYAAARIVVKKAGELVENSSLAQTGYFNFRRYCTYHPVIHQQLHI